MINYHLAILKKPYLDLVLSGQKTIESRFTVIAKPPFGLIKAGDIIFLKQSSGPVCAIAQVQKVLFFSGLTKTKIEDIKQKYNHLIKGPETFWQQTAGNCQFATLIWLSLPKSITPTMITKQDMRAWVVLSEKENYGLLKNNKPVI